MRRVWHPTSTNELNGNLCGTQFTLEDDQSYITSGPFGGRYPGQGDAVLGQQTFRDWGLSPLPPDSPGQVLNLSAFIQSLFGSQYTAAGGRL